MRRREFIGAAVGTGLLYASPVSKVLSSSPNPIPSAKRSASPLTPMVLGLLIKPSEHLETTIARLKALRIPTYFLSLDDYIGKLTRNLAQELIGLLNKHGVVAAVEVVVGLSSDPLKRGSTVDLKSYIDTHFAINPI